MAERLSGGCACGAVRYEVEAEPIVMLNCHCRDCQRASGSAYAAIVVVPKSAVRLEGELRFHKVLGDNGKAVERGFCPACGSPIGTKLEKIPDILGLQAGSLDDPSRHRPTMDIFTASAQPWDHMSPETRKVPQDIGG
jgi:hypothetical protein